MSRIRKRDHNMLTNAVSLLICGLLAGVVVAAAAFPAVAMSGLAAKAGAETFDSLPAELKDQRAPQVSRVYASDGQTQLAIIFDEHRSDVPLADISKHMQDAIIAAEDHGFRQHNGVDPKGIARAFVANNSSGRPQQGASTLTMQYVRMSIAYSATHPQDVVAATVDTAGRKAREARQAIQVSKILSKDQILERYLNMAPFGNGAYGVRAASQVYFGKDSPKDLTVAEAALLAGLVKAPSDNNPITPEGNAMAVGRRNWVIDQMVSIKAITPEQAAEAKKVEVKREVTRARNGCVNVAKNHWGFFCDYFLRWWNSQEQFGETPYDREQRLKTGGYRIVTSLDINAQEGAYESIQEEIKNNNPNALLMAGVEPGTGRVRSLAVNRTFKLDDPNNPENGMSTKNNGQRGTYPNTTNPLITGGGDITGYQAGSTFKLFTLVAALEQGYPLSYTIDAKKQFVSNFPGDPGEASTCQGRFYCPKNAGDYMAGSRNMWTAFGMSVNTYFIPLHQRIGARKTVEAAKKLGIRFLSAEEAKMAEEWADGWGAFPLGVTTTTPLDLANAYATLAADGTYCEPIPVQEIEDHSGKKLDLANPRCHEKRISVDVARAALDASRCPVGDQSFFGRCNGFTENAKRVINKPIFGKSGTTDGERTATMLVGTKSLVFAGILADPDNAKSGRRQSHDIVNPAVVNALAKATKDKPAENFNRPSDKLVFGDQRGIPDVKCKSIGDARSRLTGAGFQVEVDSAKVDSSCPANTVASTDPSGSTVRDGVVTIRVSNGRGGGNSGSGQGGRPGGGGNGRGNPD